MYLVLLKQTRTERPLPFLTPGRASDTGRRHSSFSSAPSFQHSPCRTKLGPLVRKNLWNPSESTGPSFLGQVESSLYQKPWSFSSPSSGGQRTLSLLGEALPFWCLPAAVMGTLHSWATTPPCIPNRSREGGFRSHFSVTLPLP